MELNKKEYKVINIDKIEDSSENSFSYFNSMKYEKIKSFLKKVGQIKNIVVYFDSKKKKYKIIDGYYVYKSLKELGQKEVIVYILDLKEICDYYYSILLNIKFDEDLVKLAKMIKKLLLNSSSSELYKILPFEKEEIEKYPLLLEYDFKKYDVTLHNNLFMENNDEYF